MNTFEMTHSLSELKKKNLVIIGRIVFFIFECRYPSSNVVYRCIQTSAMFNPPMLYIDTFNVCDVWTFWLTGIWSVLALVMLLCMVRMGVALNCRSNMIQ